MSWDQDHKDELSPRQLLVLWAIRTSPCGCRLCGDMGAQADGEPTPCLACGRRSDQTVDESARRWFAELKLRWDEGARAGRDAANARAAAQRQRMHLV